MDTPLYYPLADKKTQNYVNRFPGRAISPNVLVIHTMEVDGWPGYTNGNTAPHLGLRVYRNSDGSLKDFKWRQHFPFNRTARALLNKSGGVETNNSSQGVIQVELAGTCGWASPRVSPNWADPVVLRQIGEPLIDFLVFANQELGIQLVAPLPFRKWNASHPRMSYANWLKFRGICGHQHVPENSHVDPGLIDIDWLITQSKKKIAGNVTTPSVPVVPVVPYVPAEVKVTGVFDKATIKLTQYITGLRGNDIDGVWGPKSKEYFQKWLIVKRDGVIGPISVLALQKRIGIPKADQDKKWGPQTTTYLQRYLNKKVVALNTQVTPVVPPTTLPPVVTQ